MVLVGGDIPDIDHDNVSEKTIAFHNQSILALFKPSRSDKDVKHVAVPSNTYHAMRTKHL